MPRNDTLVVPVEVAALAVNPQVRDTDDSYLMYRWQANFFTLVEENLPPEPVPFNGHEPWRDKPERLGAYVQWQLPSGLTHGRETPDGVGDFPLVPNRWLVTRRWEGGMRSWLVESDHVGLDTGTVSCLDPRQGEPTVSRLGRKHELTARQAWTEPEDRCEPFLTALGSGLLTFPVYQPYNTNVFSLHDRLDDVTSDARISYRVIGWYAEESADVLSRDLEFGALMDDLEWLLPTAFGAPRRSVYAGSVLGVDWRPQGGIPDSDNPHPDDVVVAIGNSTAEASAALEEQTQGAGALDAGQARLFKAFALGCLDELDRTDGDLFPDRAAHSSGFGPAPGGFTWRVVDRADHTTRSQRTRSHPRTAQDVLAELNTRQAELDREIHELTAAREHLFHLWSLSREPQQPADFPDWVRDQLDPDVPGSAAHRVAESAAKVAALTTDVPWSQEQEQVESLAREYAAAHGLPAGYVLQRVPLEPYDEAADPVVLLRGANLHAPMSRETSLPCRVEERLVRAVGPVNEYTVAADIAQVNTVGLPAIVPALLTEFCVLDTALARGLDLADADGALPEHGIRPWRQPWQPLFLLWTADYTPASFHDWQFDGTRYRWLGTGDMPFATAASGRQIITPTAGFDLSGKLAAYANGRTDLSADTITGLRTQLLGTDQLSQRLDGLSAQIGQRRTGSGLRPTGKLANLIADAEGAAPRPGTLPQEEWEDPEPSDFQELRAGHLMFTRLAVVDRFGRAVSLIDDPAHFTAIRPHTMEPDHPVGEVEPDRFVQLPPRLLQPARLTFHFVDGHTGDQVDLTAGANPVCAWLLHNRLDRSLVCYAPDGTALGDLRVVLVPSGEREVVWTSLPDAPITDFDQLADLSRHAHALLAGVIRQGPAAFDALRTTIDDALSAIDPDGPDDAGLAYFFGRPLALVRARLTLELCGPPRRDVNWSNVVRDDVEPELIGYEWTIRLGEAAQLDDGLVGYALDGDYDHFDTVVEPVGGSDGYLRHIDRGQRLRLTLDGKPAEVTMLLDSRAAVHATTEILPVGEVFVPQEFTDQALEAMAVAFRAGPLLAGTAPDETGDPLLIVPPAGTTGSWSWAERDDAGWSTTTVTTPEPNRWPHARDLRIHTGFMVLDHAVQASWAPQD